MTKIIAWLWYSSKDPQKVSLFVKMTGLAMVPYVLQAVGLTCTLGYICISVDAVGLSEFVQHVANIVLFVLLIVAHAGAIYGFVRKVLNTVVR